MPVFHRLNDIAGSLFIALVLLVGLFLLVAMVGRLSGIQVNFVAASAAVFLIFELKRIRLIAALIAIAIALHIASWVLFTEGLVVATRSALSHAALHHRGRDDLDHRCHARLLRLLDGGARRGGD